MQPLKRLQSASGVRAKLRAVFVHLPAQRPPIQEPDPETVDSPHDQPPRPAPRAGDARAVKGGQAHPSRLDYPLAPIQSDMQPQTIPVLLDSRANSDFDLDSAQDSAERRL